VVIGTEVAVGAAGSARLRGRVWGALLLIIFGALVAGLAVAAATALGWALWHHWPRPGGIGRDEVGHGLVGVR
jgi:hypothetical protein